MLEHIIYGVLLQGEMTGYEIKRFMTLSTAHFYDASFGSIYPMLRKLEKKGTLRSTDSVGEGRFKRRYALTDAGRTDFLDWLHRPIPFSRSGHEFLIPVFFYDLIPPEEAEKLLLGFMEAVRAELSELGRVEDEIRGLATSFQLATLAFGFGHYKQVLAWCDEQLRSLEAGEFKKVPGAVVPDSGKKA